MSPRQCVSSPQKVCILVPSVYPVPYTVSPDSTYYVPRYCVSCPLDSVYHVPQTLCIMFPRKCVSCPLDSVYHVPQTVGIMFPRNCASCPLDSVYHVPQAVCIMFPRQWAPCPIDSVHHIRRECVSCFLDNVYHVPYTVCIMFPRQCVSGPIDSTYHVPRQCVSCSHLSSLSPGVSRGARGGAGGRVNTAVIIHEGVMGPVNDGLTKTVTGQHVGHGCHSNLTSCCPFFPERIHRNSYIGVKKLTHLIPTNLAFI